MTPATRTSDHTEWSAEAGAPLCGRAFAASPSSPAVSPLTGFNPSQEGRMRTWANLFDSLERETEDQRWLRNAAQWLRDNPDTSEGPS